MAGKKSTAGNQEIVVGRSKAGLRQIGSLILYYSYYQYVINYPPWARLSPYVQGRPARCSSAIYRPMTTVTKSWVSLMGGTWKPQLITRW